jgi:site-specific DNA recombinase
MPRCAIYARYSSDRQSETSAEDQVRDCRTRADREGWDVVDVYSDLAISGASNRRPGMTAMLADAAAGSFDIVLSEALDRIARNQADIATIYQKLQFANVQIETLSEGTVNELHIGLKGTMGALFLKDLAEKIRRGQRGSVARGLMPGGLCYGYDVVRELDEHGQVQAGRRRINPDQAAVVLRIIQGYVDGVSPKQIAHDLNRDGIPSARGGEWRQSAILGNKARMLGILHNPIYVGRFAYNRVHMKRDPETRNRVIRPNAADQIIFAEVPELRIVSDELWQAAQDARSTRAAYPLVQRRRPKHLLSGLIRCGACQGSFTVVADTRFGCTRHREAGTCDNGRRVEGAELQSRVLVGLKEQLLSAEAVSLLVREYHEARAAETKAAEKAQRTLGAKLKKEEAAVTRLVAAIADGSAGFADLKSALAERVAARDRLRAELAEEQSVPVIVLEPRIAERYRERVSMLIEGLSDAIVAGDPTAEQIRKLVEVVYVSPTDDGTVNIEVVGLLHSAVALATGVEATPSIRRGSLAHTLVAEEGLEPPTPGL